MSNKNKLFDNLRLPVIAAPMFLVSNPDLVIAACKSGIIGSFPGPNTRTIEDLENWLKRITSELAAFEAAGGKPAPWAMNMITHRSYSRFEEELELVKKYKPGILITALGGPQRVIDAVHSYGGLVYADVINVKYARKSAEAGADGLVLVCAGAGGHTGTVSHFAFLEEVKQFFDGHIVLSGSISNGKAIRAAEVAGADLAYIGTPFIATTENMAPPGHRTMVVDVNLENIIPTKAISGALGNWIDKSLENAGFDFSKLNAAAKIDFSGDMHSGSKAWKNIFAAGQGVGQVKKVKPVKFIVEDFAKEYYDCLLEEANVVQQKLAKLKGNVGAQRILEDRPNFHSPKEMFWHAVDNYPDTLALIQAGKQLTYKELGNCVVNFGAALKAKLKTHARGEKAIEDLKIGVYFNGSIQTVMSLYAIWNIGAQVSMHNGVLSAKDVKKRFDLIDVDFIITSKDLHQNIQKLTSEYEGRIIELDDFSNFKTAGNTFPKQDWTKIDTNETILYLFSGGTTGTPKSIEHSHFSIMSGIRGMEYAWPTVTNKETWVSVAPMSHVYGILFCLFDPIYSCATNVLVYPFKSAKVIEALQNHNATVYSGGPPASYNAILQAADENTVLPYLRICGGGGASFPVELLQKLQSKLGIKVTEAYGMTEIAPISSNNPYDGNKYGSVGKAGLKVEVKILDLKTQQALPANESGMICVKGAAQMKYYHNNPEETAKTVIDGWIHTGDVGYLDEEGFIFITGRVKEMINVSGYKVFPREVDERVVEFENVIESCTYGVSDERSGEAVATAIVVKNPVEFSMDGLMEYLKNSLTYYKLPKHLTIVDSIPKTQANKQDRMALKKNFESKSTAING